MELSTARTSPHFEIRTDVSGTRLSLIGEIDYESQHVLSTQIERAAANATAGLTVDMSQVTFTDSVALRVLMAIQARFAAITIESPSPPARLLLELPCVRGLFDIIDVAS